MSSAKAEDVEVRFEDQERINEFGRLNNRLLEIKADIEQSKADHDKLDDSTAELMLACGDKIMLLVGEAFVEVSEDTATEYCNKKQEKLQERITRMQEEQAKILSRQAELKTILYGRFGDSINLEA